MSPAGTSPHCKQSASTDGVKSGWGRGSFKAGEQLFWVPLSDSRPNAACRRHSNFRSSLTENVQSPLALGHETYKRPLARPILQLSLVKADKGDCGMEGSDSEKPNRNRMARSAITRRSMMLQTSRDARSLSPHRITFRSPVWGRSHHAIRRILH